MAKKKQASPGVIRNRRARFDYELGDHLVAGIILSGAETKALRMHHGSLRGAFVTVKDGELWLNNATISGTNGIPIDETTQVRARKLLVSKKELGALIAAKQQDKSIIPTDILTKGRFIKVRIAIGTGKKTRDKRSVIRERDLDREAHRAMKRH